MTTPERKPPKARLPFLLIAGSSALLLILIGIGLYLWKGTLWPLIITASSATILLIVLIASYFVMNRRAHNDSAITVSKRYGITWSDRAEDVIWKQKQVRNIVITALLIVAVLAIFGWFVLRPLLLAPGRNATDIALIGGGVIAAIMLVGAIIRLFRRLVAMPPVAGWRWATITAAAVMILLGGWLFYGGHFPSSWVSISARHSMAGAGPLVALGIVAFFALIAALTPETESEGQRQRLVVIGDMAVFGAVVFWLSALIDMFGAAVIPMAIPLVILVVGAALVYVLDHIGGPLGSFVRDIFGALLQALAAVVKSPVKGWRIVWNRIKSSRWWNRADAWLDLQGNRLSAQGQHALEWTEALLQWINDVNGATDLKTTRTKWATADAKRGADLRAAREEFSDRLKEINKPQEDE